MSHLGRGLMRDTTGSDDCILSILAEAVLLDRTYDGVDSDAIEEQADPRRRPVELAWATIEDIEQLDVHRILIDQWENTRAGHSSCPVVCAEGKERIRSTLFSRPVETYVETCLVRLLVFTSIGEFHLNDFIGEIYGSQ